MLPIGKGLRGVDQRSCFPGFRVGLITTFPFQMLYIFVLKEELRAKLHLVPLLAFMRLTVLIFEVATINFSSGKDKFFEVATINFSSGKDKFFEVVTVNFSSGKDTFFEVVTIKFSSG